MKFFIIIKEHSERLPDKNFLELGDKPLFKHLLDELEGEEVFATPALLFFLENKFRKKDFENNPKLLHQFAKLDDHDILSSLKQWTTDDDNVLALLSNMIINRKLLKVKIQQKPFSQQEISKHKKEVMKRLKITEEKVNFFGQKDFPILLWKSLGKEGHQPQHVWFCLRGAF